MLFGDGPGFHMTQNFHPLMKLLEIKVNRTRVLFPTTRRGNMGRVCTFTDRLNPSKKILINYVCFCI